MKSVNVAAVIVVYSNRWKFLSRVLDKVVKDDSISQIIVVDNGSANEIEIRSFAASHEGRMVHIRHEKNLGSAGGFHAGLARARQTECDYVLLLDDDMVPEENFISYFLKVEELFDKKVVLSGNRPNLLENREYFYQSAIPSTEPRGTFFDVFSIAKIKYFIKLAQGKYRKIYKRGPFIPVIPTEAFIYGGAFIPIEAVREADLPDPDLFLYGDDVEYSWNIKKLGYDSYLTYHPIFEDIDFTFGSNDSHIFGQFDSKTPAFKVYYRLRNMIRLSRKHSKQQKIILFLNVLLWTLGLCLLGFIRYGMNVHYFRRCRIIWSAFLAGYNPNHAMPKEAEPPQG